MIISISATIELEPLCDRWYRLAAPVEIVIWWRGLELRYKFAAGFEFDGRSGGPLADFVVPNLGTQEQVACWLIHDANGYGSPLGFSGTNALLRDMLRSSGCWWLRSQIVWCAVSISRSWYGFPLPGDREFRNVHPVPMFSVAVAGDGARI